MALSSSIFALLNGWKIFVLALYNLFVAPDKEMLKNIEFPWVFWYSNLEKSWLCVKEKGTACQTESTSTVTLCLFETFAASDIIKLFLKKAITFSMNLRL